MGAGQPAPAVTAALARAGLPEDALAAAALPGLAGVVNEHRGRPWSVALLINPEPAAKGRPVLDAFVDDLARQGPYVLVPPSFMNPPGGW